MSDRTKVRDCIEQARGFVREGQREKALAQIRKALALDPEEILITDTILSLEERGDTPPPPAPKISAGTRPLSPGKEASKTLDPKLEKALQLSEACRIQGDTRKALAYLQKARELCPNNVVVQSRLSALAPVLNAERLLQTARGHLENNNPGQAVAAARKAFQTAPDVPGLPELLQEIEFRGGKTSSADPPADTPEASPDDLIEQVRLLVKEDRWDDAATLVENAVAEYPDNELLETFRVKFKRLGLLG